MARRPSFEKERVLSRTETKQLQDDRANLSQEGVRQVYERAYRECRIVAEISRAHFLKQLVQAWKQLRKWKQK
jgi:hypothetical protein